MPVKYIYDQRPGIIYYYECASMDKNCVPVADSELVHLWVNRLLYKPYKIYQQQMCILKHPQQNTMHGSDPDTHGYKCPCSNCESKFGSLPLFLEVIESQQQSDEPLNLTTPSSSASHTVTESHKTEPSTSGLPSPVISAENKTEASTSGLKSPVRRKEIKCSECDKVFTHRGDYNKHARRHSGEKPFECHVCQKKFSHTSNLTRHLKVHSGDRPFKCENCGKSFSRKDKLEAHMSTVICKKRGIVNKLNQ